MRLPVLAGMLAFVALMPSAAAGGAVRTTFADGTWAGTAPVKGGISKTGIQVSGAGTARFRFTVRNAKVTGGTMILLVNERGSVAGHEFTGKVSGRLRMSGTAARPTASGSVSVTSTVLGVSTTISVPGGGVIHGAGTCNRMTGDFAVRARQAQQAAGFATTLTARFVARRGAGAGC